MNDALGSAYRLLEPLGEGAMGTVWRALDRRTDEHVAAKILHRHLSTDPEIVARFVRERTVLLRLRHPGIVSIRDFVLEGERIAIVMDLVTGGDLGALRRRSGTFTPARAAGYAAELAAALAHAHGEGIVHCDVKPANVLVDTETLRLTDFGVARILHSTTAHTSGTVAGTPVYMAPEIIAGERPAPPADVYALGMVLYELLAGRAPFAAGHSLSALHCAFQMAPRRLPGMPEVLWRVIEGCTAKDPGVRPPLEHVIASLRSAVPALGAAPALAPVSREAPLAATAVPLTPLSPPLPVVSGGGRGEDTQSGRGENSTIPPASVAATGGGAVAGNGKGRAAPRSGRRALIAVGACAVAAAAVTALFVTIPRDEPTRLVSQGRPTAPESTPPSTSPATSEVPGATTKSDAPETTRKPSRGSVTTTTKPPKPVQSPKAVVTKPPVKTTAPKRTVRPAEEKKPEPTKEPVTKQSAVAPEPEGETSPEPKPQVSESCRSWGAAGSGVYMSPCIKVSGGKIYMMGRMRGPVGMAADIGIELYDSRTETTVSKRLACHDMRFAYEGEIETCGWYEVSAATGRWYVTKQRWKRTGTSAFGGGLESAEIRW